MKAVFMSYEYPPHIYGGVGIHVKYLTEALSKFMQIEVRTIGEKYEVENNVRRYPTWNFLIEKGIEQFSSFFKAAALDLAVVSEKIDADLVHVHTWYLDMAGFYAKMLYNIPYVATVHSLEPLRPWKRDSLGSAYFMSLWMEKTGLSNADKLIAVSQEMKSDIHKHYEIPLERIEVIHNGIDIEKYRFKEDPEVLKKYGIEGEYVLFVGRLTKQKGVFELAQVADRIKANVVFLTGKPDNPEYLTEFEKIVKNKKNAIWINKMIPEEELIPIYSGSSLFVCPSIYEPFGIINLEAMACERAVVATRVGGIPEVVEDGETGILVPVGDWDVLVRSVNELLADETRRKEMGKKGRKRVEDHFSWDAIARKTYALYKNVTGKE